MKKRCYRCSLISKEIGDMVSLVAESYEAGVSGRIEFNSIKDEADDLLVSWGRKIRAENYMEYFRLSTLKRFILNTCGLPGWYQTEDSYWTRSCSGCVVLRKEASRLSSLLRYAYDEGASKTPYLASRTLSRLIEESLVFKVGVECFVDLKSAMRMCRC